MNTSIEWNRVSGFNSGGEIIKKDLDLMSSGHMGDEEICELLTEFVRDGGISSAAIPALKYLTGDLAELSPESRLNCLYTACLILGHAQKDQTAFNSLEESSPESLCKKTLGRFLQAASNHELNSDWKVSIAAVVLLLNKDESSYKRLVENGHL
jgi:hypothetical protein